MSLTNSLPRSTGLLGRLDTHARGSLGAPDNTGRLLNLTIGDPDSSRRTAPPWSACSRGGPPWSRHRCQGSALGGFHQKSHHKRYGSRCVHDGEVGIIARRFCLSALCVAVVSSGWPRRAGEFAMADFERVQSGLKPRDHRLLICSLPGHADRRRRQPRSLGINLALTPRRARSYLTTGSVDMKTIEISRPGGPEVLKLVDAELPKAEAGQVVIRVAAAGVNRPDLAQRAGRYPVPKDANPRPGLEVAGVIEDVGEEVLDFAVGDRVMALTHGGGYAEFCVADRRHVMLVPYQLDDVRAAALPEVMLTVEFNMIMRAALRRGETVLIHGGSSGIGSHAIRRATSIGAVPITTSRGGDKREFCMASGAAHAIDSSSENWADRVREITNGRGVDVILDMVGAEFVAPNLASLADDGRYALISLQGGAEVRLNLEPVLRRRLTMTGSTLRPLPAARKGEIVDAVRSNVLPLLALGHMLPSVHKTFPLERAADAHRLMESGLFAGKIVLTVGCD